MDGSPAVLQSSTASAGVTIRPKPHALASPVPQVEPCKECGPKLRRTGCGRAKQRLQGEVWWSRSVPHFGYIKPKSPTGSWASSFLGLFGLERRDRLVEPIGDDLRDSVAVL